MHMCTYNQANPSNALLCVGGPEDPPTKNANLLTRGRTWALIEVDVPQPHVSWCEVGSIPDILKCQYEGAVTHPFNFQPTF